MMTSGPSEVCRVRESAVEPSFLASGGEPVGSHSPLFAPTRAENAAYVCLGEEGADGLMRKLYEALTPEKAKRDVCQRYRDWSALVWNR